MPGADVYERGGAWFRRYEHPRLGERWDVYRIQDRRLLYLHKSGAWVAPWELPMEDAMFASEAEAEEALAKAALLGGG